MKKIRYNLHLSIIIIVFLLTIIISVIPASSGDPLDRVVEILAQREISENELDEALSIVKDVLNKEPDNPKALYYAGRVYMVRKEYDIAIKQFQKALSLEKRGSSYLCLGLCYKNKEQPDLYKAKECFKNARELFIIENDNPEFYENTLRELVSITSGYEQDKYKEELQNFLDSGKRIPTPAPTPTPTRTPTPTSTPTPTRTPTPTPTPHPAMVHCDRGAEYLSRKQYDEAIKEYEEALSINSSIAEAWYNLGVIWDIKGDKEKSMENFKKYLEVKPDADDRYDVECIILMLQGAIYYTQGRYWKAIETFQQVVNLDPAHVSAYFNLGMSYDKVQKYEAATEAYEKAVTADPGNASAHYNLAVHYEYLGRNSEAVKHYKEYLRLSPDAEDKEDVEQKIRKLD